MTFWMLRLLGDDATVSRPIALPGFLHRCEGSLERAQINASTLRVDSDELSECLYYEAPPHCRECLGHPLTSPQHQNWQLGVVGVLLQVEEARLGCWSGGRDWEAERRVQEP